MQFNESPIINFFLEIASKKSEIFAFFGTKMWHFGNFGSVTSFVFLVKGKTAIFKAINAMSHIFFCNQFKNLFYKILIFFNFISESNV